MAAVNRGSRSALYLGALILSLSALAGCNGGGGGGDSGGSTPSSSSATAPSAPGAPTISGSAVTSVKPNTAYSFKPTASDPDGDTLSFAIQNKPAWATFNTVTGELTGTPTMAQTGTYKDIVISASDGKATAQLQAFTITVSENASPAGSGSVTLSWTAPTENVDGSALTDLSGFVISYGTSAEALSQTVTVDNASVDRYVLDNLAPGTYYFAVRAVAASGAESEQSQVVSKVVG
jgi:hypothetical protein